MRKWVVRAVEVVALSLLGTILYFEWAAANDPTSSFLTPGTRCAVTNQGVIRDTPAVFLEVRGAVLSARLEPGVMVRVGNDFDFDASNGSWMGRILVTVETGE